MLEEFAVLFALSGVAAGLFYLSSFKRLLALYSIACFAVSTILFIAVTLLNNEPAVVAAVSMAYYNTYGRPAPLGVMYYHAPALFNAAITGGSALGVYALYAADAAARRGRLSLRRILWH